MEQYVIKGGRPLEGEVTIAGAKNAALGILAAAVMTDQEVTIENVPNVRDTRVLLQAIQGIGARVRYIDEHTVAICGGTINPNTDLCVDDEYIRKIRASYYLLGALLGKYNHSQVALPGGCDIGARPIDLHIKGFEALGAKVEVIKNKYIITADKLVGARIKLDIASVGATINLMLASTYAEGETIIENAAREPEIVNVAKFLISMGCNITGAGTSTIVVRGSNHLDNGITEILPDRIEASTYIIIGALTGKDLKIKGFVKEDINAVLIKLKEIGANFEINGDTLSISKCTNILPTNITTQVFPGFPTDIQQVFTVLLTQAKGTSTITETIYESRFVSDGLLNKMGASTSAEKNVLQVTGPTPLTGKELYIPDLRGGAALVAAALIASGTTILDNIPLILRGYEDIVEKLTSVGADLELID